MTAASCSRIWQAEAAFDGRLSPSDRASFERHSAGCAACSAELLALKALQTAAENLPDIERSAFEHRRRRNELLRRANDVALGQSRQAPRRAVLASLAVAAGVALWLWKRPADPEARAVSPTYRMTASPGAEWRGVERTATVRLALVRGRFELTVDKLVAGQRFLLDLPDGELEVKGTRFVVDVDGGTQAVQVIDGRVALRLVGREPVLLSGGQSWPPPPLEAPSSLPEPEPATKAPPPASKSAPSPVHRSTAAAAAAAPRPGSAFALAMDAFSAGDYGRAESLFVEFERRHPGDARVEDATFLRAVARARRGDAAGARATAREYLRRYPNGLRRDEAERLAR